MPPFPAELETLSVDLLYCALVISSPCPFDNSIHLIVALLPDTSFVSVGRGSCD